MQLANNITLSVYKAAYESAQPGMTNRQFSQLIDAAYTRCGVTGDASCQVGEYSALPHGSLQPQVIREGEIILIDDGCTVEGYQSDITRTFVLGSATAKMNKVFDIVKRAQGAALKAAKPGAPLESIDAAARDVIVAAGYGPGFKYFSHRLGHGIGMDVHERPFISPEDETPLRAGMTFTDEPSIIIPGRFSLRIEDIVVCDEGGGRKLNAYPAALVANA